MTAQAHRTKLLPCIAAAFALPLVFAAALAAEPRADDDGDALVAEHLARSLQLFDDARTLAQAIGDTDRRNVTLARIARIEGDLREEPDKSRLYKEGLELLSASTSNTGRLNHATMTLDFIEANGAKDLPFAKVDDALAKLLNVKEDIDKRKIADFNWFKDEQGNASRDYTDYFDVSYQLARAFYLRGLAEPVGSPKRTESLKKVASTIMALRFEKIDEVPIPIPYFDAYILEGDARSRNLEFRDAINAYDALPQFLADSGFPRSNPNVEYQSLRGYIKAVEVLLTELGRDMDAVKEARALIARALREFPWAVTGAQGKELKMYDISALVKLGENIDGALKDLFKFIDDGDPVFRFKAANQLGRIAQDPRLSNAQRLACSLKALSVADYGSMLPATHALQALLANLTSLEEFETYGPICYVTLGDTYEVFKRYLDAALIFREGSERFFYLRGKYGEEGSDAPLPAHFFNEAKEPVCNPPKPSDKYTFTLATKGNAFQFPKALGERALMNARLLGNKEYGGDPANEDFKRFRDDMDQWFNSFRGVEQLYTAIKKEGILLYNKSEFFSAAQVLMSTLPADGAMAMNYLAAAGLNQELDKRSVNITGIVKPDDFFKNGYDLPGNDILPEQNDFWGQEPRLETDFRNLPDNLRADVLMPSIAQLSGPGMVQDRLQYLWLLTQYAFKRALLFQLNTDAERITAAGHDLSTMTLPQACAAHAEVINQGWMKTPEGQRMPNSIMYDMGKTIYYLTRLLRNPRVDDSNRDRLKARTEELVEANAAEALAFLRMAGKAYDPHFDIISRKGSEESDREGAPKFKLALLTLRFDAFIKSGMVNEAYDDFLLFRESYITSSSAPAKNMLDTQRKLLSNLIHAFNEYELPRVYAIERAASELRAAALRLTKNEFPLFARSRYVKANPDKKFEELPSAEQLALTEAEILDFISDRAIGSGASLTMKDETYRFADYLPNEFADFEKEWEALEERYADRFNLAAVNAVELARTGGNAKDAEPMLKAALDMVKSKGADAALDFMAKEAAAMTAKDDRKGSLYTWLASEVKSRATEYRRIDGVAFRLELARYFDTRAAALEIMVRAPARRDSEIWRLFNESRGEPLYKPEHANIYGAKYARAGETRMAYDAWKTWFEHKQASFSDPSFIDLDVDRKQIANDANTAAEIDTRAEIARAALTLYREAGPGKGDAYLAEALEHLRRLYNIAMWRTVALEAREAAQWKIKFGNAESSKALERVFQGVYRDYTDICEIYAERGLKPEWKLKYYFQQSYVTKDDVLAAVKKGEIKSEFYELPETPAALFDEASFMQFQMYYGIGDIHAGRGYHDGRYRAALMRWAELRLKLADAMERSGGESAKADAQSIRGKVLSALHGAAGDEPYILDENALAFIKEVKEARARVVVLMGEEAARKQVPDLFPKKNGAKGQED